MTNTVVVTQVVNAVTVASPGPQGQTGPMGSVPIFTRQNEISPLVGETRFYFDSTRVISQLRASVGNPSVGSPVVVYTLINGTSIGTVTIPAGQNTATLAINRTVQANDYATVSIVSVGSTYSGANLTLVLTVN